MSDDLRHAGWYPESETGGTRFWDGAQWTGDHRPPRKRFAAASAHRGWGTVLLIFGIVQFIGFVFGGLSVVVTGRTSRTLEDGTIVTISGSEAVLSGVGMIIFGLVVSSLLTLVGFYLLRGQGPSTKSVVEKARTARDYDLARSAFESEAKKSAAPRAALITAYLGLISAANKQFGSGAAKVVADACNSAGIEPSSLNVPPVAQLLGVAVYPNWLTFNGRTYDLNERVHAQFYLDEQVQTVTTSKKHHGRVVSTTVEKPRGGRLTVVVDGESMQMRVGPGGVAKARQIESYINARAQEVKEADSAVGQSKNAAELERIRSLADLGTTKALKELERMWYARQISDEEYERARRILLGNEEVLS